MSSDEVDRAIAHIREGQQFERERVVAFLRKCYKEIPLAASQLECFRSAADWIERGDHLLTTTETGTA